MMTIVLLAIVTGMPCVETTVTQVTPRLKGTGFESGVEVWFDTSLGVEKFSNEWGAGVVHYQDDTGNDVMAAEHRGDKVRVCLVSVPAPSKQPPCDPSKDPRGRVYKVYDYKQHVWYSGMNSEHECGGA